MESLPCSAASSGAANANRKATKGNFMEWGTLASSMMRRLLDWLRNGVVAMFIGAALSTFYAIANWPRRPDARRRSPRRRLDRGAARRHDFHLMVPCAQRPG